MPIYTVNFAELLEPGLREIWGDAYMMHPEEYTEIFDVAPSTRSFEEDFEITGTGYMPQKPEGQGVTYDTAYPGIKPRYDHVTYGLGIIITREMYEDDQYRKMNAMTAGLAKSVRESIEIIHANILNNGFSTSYLMSGGDGKALFAGGGSTNPAHTTPAGGTYRNELSTSADLTITSYEQMLVDLHTVPIDGRGKKLRVNPKKLVIAPANIFQASKILKSSQEPDTANNAINPAQGTMPNMFVVNHYLTDEDAWFVKTDVKNGLVSFSRRKPEFTRDNDFDTENAKYKATTRFSAGWTDPRGIFASQGA